MKKIEEIKIYGKDNGISVQVGCKTLVYQEKDLKQFFKDLADYFADPEKTKEKIYKRWGIKDDNSTTTWTEFTTHTLE